MQIYHNKTLLIFLFHHQRIMWTLKQMQSINEDNPKLKDIHNTTKQQQKREKDLSINKRPLENPVKKLFCYFDYIVSKSFCSFIYSYLWSLVLRCSIAKKKVDQQVVTWLIALEGLPGAGESRRQCGYCVGFPGAVESRRQLGKLWLCNLRVVD